MATDLAFSDYTPKMVGERPTPPKWCLDVRVYLIESVFTILFPIDNK